MDAYDRQVARRAALAEITRALPELPIETGTLVITRKAGQTLELLTADVRVQLVIIHRPNGQLQLGVRAPASVHVVRGELMQRIIAEGRLDAPAEMPVPA